MKVCADISINDDGKGLIVGNLPAGAESELLGFHVDAPHDPARGRAGFSDDQVIIS
jgi:hypothetical protein